ncbi:folate transporter 1, chloroplastic isoform X2 [Brachypodium distachyon]|uniref:folate transporter 1, chloroplastic isoform X2 n=1 Tax=Brachypodium distachyon TaxID=15368 RepID=UPI00071CFCE1|nr:folate transporter 1, chloroplastic isoform X2 [Brachypodium distachyon]|eukprot:XP_014753070.1 folate transporter 1, chloroplastic isoform X2 [Brachypodium distachyon]
MSPGTSTKSPETWTWENAAAGATAGFATVATFHPLDVVRTRFQVSGGRGLSDVPPYRNTAHAVYTIARSEGLRGLYAGFYPAVLGSTVSWGLYFFLGRMISSAHSTILSQLQKQVCLFTNPIWLVKTRMQLQTPGHTSPYSGFSDALRTILTEEGWRALYRGIGPGLLLVTHGAIQFTAYEELRKGMVFAKTKQARADNRGNEDLLNSVDYAVLGAGSKLSAILLTYPYQVIRARLQQRPGSDGTPKYSDSWHVVKETARYEGARGFYRGITSNLLKNLPAASLTFVVYENVIKLFKAAKEKK